MRHSTDATAADTEAAAVAPASAPASGTPPHVLQRAIGNAAMGRLLRSPADADADALRRRTRARRHGARLLARDLQTLNAPAEREIGPNDRPPSSVLFAAYSKVSYDVWKKGTNPPGADPEAQANGPWAFIGGSVGKQFGASDPADPAAGPKLAQHTCAARLSWALNHGFAATKIKSGVIFYNDPKVTYAGTPGDGDWYIVGAPAMEAYLRKKWGAPDVKLSKLDEWTADATGARTKTTEGDASALRAKLGPSKIAVFAGAHHVGVISQQLKTDDYIYFDPDVVPAVAWILP